MIKILIIKKRKTSGCIKKIFESDIAIRYTNNKYKVIKNKVKFNFDDITEQTIIAWEKDKNNKITIIE